MRELTAALPDPVPGLGPAVRPEALDEAAIAKLLASLPARQPELLHACLLLWHDHLEAAHVLVQAREGDPLADTLHAIMHRREPDQGNSCYWWGRVGAHPLGQELGAEARRLALAGLCTGDGRLDPLAMTRACCQAGSQLPNLGALQACELRLLAGTLLSP